MNLKTGSTLNGGLMSHGGGGEGTIEGVEDA